MAIQLNFNRIVHHSFLRILGTKKFKQYDKNVHENSVVLDIDVLDNFTSQLLQKKIDKWSTFKSTKKFGSNIENIPTNISVRNIEPLQIKEVNTLFQDAIDLEDNSRIMCLINQCIKYRKCPTLSHLDYILSLCAQSGDKQTILKIKDLCEEFYPEIIRENSHFRHYLAEAVWIKGNVPKSLNIFKEVYQENAFLRRRIRLMFKFLILDVVASRSEAILINIIKFSEDLHKEHGDFFPLTCIWQACFLSEWYTDQCLALNLLEEHSGLCEAIVNRIPYVVSVSLISHKTEVVYRLLEILLKFHMKQQYKSVLISLFDYQIRQDDLDRCSEVIKWAVENNVELPLSESQKFLNLFIVRDKSNIDLGEGKEIEKKAQCAIYKF